MAKTSLTEDLLRAMKRTLSNLATLRMVHPGDKSISDLKHAIRQKISDLERRSMVPHGRMQQPSH